MKVLITGVEGFVGGYLSQYLLSKKVEIIGTYYDENIVNHKLLDKVKLHKLNILDNSKVDSLIKKYQPDLIYHLAAQSSVSYSWEKPSDTININVNGTINLLESIANYSSNSKVMLIGSSEQYGKVSKEELPISEEQALNPNNPYAISKVTQELMADIYYKSKNLKIIKVRAFNHIGPRQAATFVISDFAKQIADIERGLVPPIIYTGNLEVKRDFLDVRDVIRAYEIISSKGAFGETYNVGLGKSYVIKELLDYMVSQSKVKITVTSDAKKMRPIENYEIVCDNSKITKLGWIPTIEITKTINDILEYYRKQQ